MILEQTKTTVAYRCPHCGAGIMSPVGVFKLNADRLVLKCQCGHSEMTITRSKDAKIRLEVPCLICRAPHNLGQRHIPLVIFTLLIRAHA